MVARQKSSRRSNIGKSEVPFLWWVGAIGIALFFLIYPYNRAMFNGYELNFEPPIYNAVIFGCCLFAVMAIYLVRKWKPVSHVDLLSIAVMLIPLIYWLSSFGAVSSYYANFMVIVYTLLALLFIAALYVAQARPTRLLIEGGVMIAGAMIVLFGLFNLFGQIYYRDALWLAHDGYRLTSVFQYSNTYAGFLIALFLIAVYYAVHSSNLYIRLLNAAFLVPIWISFMMTFSRGAIVIIPVVVLLILPFLRFSKQIAYIAYMGFAVAASMAVLGRISANSLNIASIVQPTAEKPHSPISMFSALPLQNWGLLLLASAITTGLIWLYHWKADSYVQSKLKRLSERKWSFLLIPVALVAAGTIAASLLLGSSSVRGMLPQQLADRVANINFQQHSVLERITFYKDGLSASRDYPLLGAGGGAWQAMYEQYQNNPYVSRQAHSFYVQVLVEIGWFGLLAMLALFGFIYFLYIRSHIRHPELRGSHFIFYIMSLTLLAHSAIDFDMSYVYVAALVFVSLGCMIAPYSGKLVLNRLERISFKSWQRMIYPGILSLLTVVLLVSVIQNNRAITNYNQTVTLAYQNQLLFPQLMQMIDKSIAISPDQITYSVIKANWLSQSYEQNQDEASLTLAFDTIEKAEKYDNNNRALFVQKLSLMDIGDKVEESLPVIEETLIKFPWDISFYERAVTTYGEARASALAAGDGDKAARHEQRIHEIAAEIERRIELLAALPPEQLQGGNFAFTDAINAVLSQLN